MQIQVNTDNDIHGDMRLEEVVEDAVTSELGRFEDRLTRIEVHLQDQNADKHGPAHIRCTVEARPRGAKPLAAHHDGPDIPAALKGAVKTLRGRLDSEFGKQDQRHK